ncbi:hypothetical protein CUJ89_00155 [Burkholderia pyrrocinia]|uniref:Uncharacterized protein n=1 Tax=Burkholderia pyrrocinia TaxID=60550 RepID=A0A2Z5MPF6_BURPY|nr:hypothetical protein [Burkholderia pyrrocinia]AXF19090.1 hypothetical protein CUJ89_00155 [Burkholderia pyrrocinia]
MTTSTGIAARVRTRGQFAPGELVKVSLDRPKYSREMWMLRAELDEHEVEATFFDNVAHVNEFPKIAALERLRAYVCSTCVDELLVRSGEAPYKPTTKEQAFDTSVVAANAKWPSNHARCELHGLILPTRTSPDIEAAILSIDVIRNCHVVQVIDHTKKHEPKYWFSEAFLRKVLGPDVAIEGSVLRVDDEAAFQRLWNAGELVCRTCLRDVLKRSGLIDDDMHA